MMSAGLKQASSRVLLRGVCDETLAAVVRDVMEFCEWESLVAPGSTVVVKPNVCSAVPDKWEMSNTDPRVARGLRTAADTGRQGVRRGV